MKRSFLPFVIGLGACVAIRAQTTAPAARSKVQCAVGSDRHSLVVRPGSAAEARACRFEGPVNQARISFDGAAVIVSANAYVLMKDLVHCDGASVRAAKTPQRAGMLADVNVRHDLYVSLASVSTQPMSFLAIVAKLGSKRNLVALPGSYSAGKSSTRQSKQAFSYDDANGPYAKISPNGRCVSVDGILDCSPDSFPGVWDLAARKRVVMADDPASRDDRCKALFSAPSAR